MSTHQSLGVRKFLFVAIFFLLLALLGGGVWLWLSWNPGSDWRLAEAWRGEDLNHPGPVGQEIVAGAVAYLETKPVYDGSKVFPGGVPTDGTGVCTDVVWYAVKAAGMDLRELVDADRRADPKAYAAFAPAGEQPNPDIDYRRVRNLMVFFDRHATQLTTDTSEVEAWQPGDLVVWKEHIAVISDRRNAEGLPYVLHHEGSLPWSRYEVDAFRQRGEALRHYRLEALAMSSHS